MGISRFVRRTDVFPISIDLLNCRNPTTCQAVDNLTKVVSKQLCQLNCNIIVASKFSFRANLYLQIYPFCFWTCPGLKTVLMSWNTIVPHTLVPFCPTKQVAQKDMLQLLVAVFA